MAPEKGVQLSKNETDVLLGLYSGCESLWNTKSTDYKTRAIRLAAVRTIINGMRLETGKDFTADEVLTSLRSLKVTYERELQQVLKEETGPGLPYKSQWRWFHFLDSFLRNQVLQKEKDPDGCSAEDGEDVEVEGSKQTAAGSSDTDDYDCTVVDSDNDASNSTESRTGAPSHVSNNCQTSCLPGSSRVVRLRRPQTGAVTAVNGDCHSVERQTATRHSSRKKQRVSLFSPDDYSACSESKTRKISKWQTNTNSQSKTTHHRQASNTPSHENSQPATQGGLSLQISSQIADTLKAVQTLLAKSLSDQDQPSMVFARHIANELDLITDYQQRKLCMLEIQQVIMGYQTGQRETVSVKHEKNFVNLSDDVIVVSGSATSAPATVQSVDASLPVHFGTPKF